MIPFVYACVICLAGKGKLCAIYTRPEAKEGREQIHEKEAYLGSILELILG